MQNELTKKEQRLMRHWFKKTGENTIELKEKRWAAVKIVLIIFTVIAVYYNFIDPRYQNMTKPTRFGNEILQSKANTNACSYRCSRTRHRC